MLIVAKQKISQQNYGPELELCVWVLKKGISKVSQLLGCTFTSSEMSFLLFSRIIL